MNTNENKIHEQIWQDWTQRIEDWDLRDFAVSMMEASRPLHLVGAQLLYMSEPLLNGLVGREQLHALTSLLEDPQESRQFIDHLQGGRA